MDVNQPLPLLGGLSPAQFMRRHWQKKPLLVRAAIARSATALDRNMLFALAARDDVQSRLVESGPAHATGWRLRHGPFSRRALPPLKRGGWSLLVQGVDLHVDRVHELLNRFRFIPDARIDDVMVSYASDGGGVGPHFDSYDVFLLQALGRRRWRIGRQKDRTLRSGMPLKILRSFDPEQDVELDTGDMLYLPPGCAHDGVAIGECMTYSVGFRAPGQSEIAAELLQRIGQSLDASAARIFRDPTQRAVQAPGAIPARLRDFARLALQQAVQDTDALQKALGEYLTEPKPEVWFDARNSRKLAAALRLDRRTRMMYDEHTVFVNGESYPASGRDAALMRKLADARGLGAADTARASAQALSIIADWYQAGWIHGA